MTAPGAGGPDMKSQLSRLTVPLAIAGVCVSAIGVVIGLIERHYRPDMSTEPLHHALLVFGFCAVLGLMLVNSTRSS